MALLYPDILNHSNPNNALVDTDFIKGGTRSAVNNLTSLYQLSAKAGTLGQLKNYATRVWVASEGKFYTLIDEISAMNSSGWATDNQTLSGVLNSGIFNTTTKFVSAFDSSLTVNYLTKAINSNGINESIVYDDGVNVGINTNTPNKPLTVNGEISANNTIYDGQGNSSQWNSAHTTVKSNSATNWDNALSNAYTHTNFLPLSGGTITESLTVNDVLQVGNGDVVFYVTDDKVGINTDTPNEALTVVGNISALNDVFVSQTVFAQSFITTTPNLIVFDTASISAFPVTTLPTNANDIELLCTSVVIITAFQNGIKGAVYCLTNKGTNMITITSSPMIVVRNGTSWSSNTTSLSTAYLTLPLNGSCSLRADVDNKTSVW